MIAINVDDDIKVLDGVISPAKLYKAWQWCNSEEASWQWHQYGKSGHKMETASFWGSVIANPEEGSTLAQAPQIFSDLWDAVRQLHPGNLSLFRCFLNGQTFGDDSDPHKDASQRTCVIYLNPIWDPMWQGETLFYKDEDLTDISMAICPKPNRVISFPGGVTHWGRAPSRYCLIRRITIAFQFNYQ